FLSIDPGSGAPARLTIVDISDPANPVQVFSQEMGNPFVHDVFVRDGLLFTALWNDGLKIWDIGGTHGGSPSNPVAVGTVLTVGGEAHNVLWFHDPADGSRRYAFVGEEGPGVVGSRSNGDIHVVDVTDPAAPREVAFYHVPGAGTHNFSADEASGVLYAAFYNAGIRALDIRGDLGSCTVAQRSVDGRCDLGLMGRELARGLVNNNPMPVYAWGVQHVGTRLFASDMLNGLWVLDAAALARSN
ncbi:MAG: LVIVD repeat-containing protein, partial [Gemmatimonadaceae bacterium]